MRARLFAALLVILAAGCTGGSERQADQASPGPKTDKPFKVALLTPGPVSDAGWSAMAYEGLTAIKTELGAEVNNQVASNVGEIKDAMRQYAQDGYSLVIGHGYEYNEPGANMA